VTSILIYCNLKVRIHPANVASAGGAVPQAIATSKSSRATAAEILGLKGRRNYAKNDSVESEVDRYLHETEEELDGILFWQVLTGITHKLQKDSNSPLHCRHFSKNIQEYFPLPWTYCLFQPQLFLVKEYFHLQKKP